MYTINNDQCVYISRSNNISLIKFSNSFGKSVESIYRLLLNVIFISEGKLTVAGELLFAKNPEKFFPSYRIRFIRYDGLEYKVGTEMNIIKDINIIKL